jgi:hypothetical protein
LVEGCGDGPEKAERVRANLCPPPNLMRTITRWADLFAGRDFLLDPAFLLGYGALAIDDEANVLCVDPFVFTHRPRPAPQRDKGSHEPAI